MPKSSAIAFFHRIGAWTGVLAAGASLLLTAPMPVAGDGRAGSMINCDIQSGPCEKKLADTTVTLDIFPRPVRAMRDLTFRVTIGDPQMVSAAPYIDLNMPAMDMGTNKVLLKDIGGGAFEGRGIIVRCMSGRRTWRARITLPDLGQADFIFDVIY